MIRTKIAIDSEECMPYRAHKWDAGWDLKSNNSDFVIKPGEKVKVHTGVRIGIAPRYMGLVVPRSGLGSKFRITLANVVGVIDCGYTGEIIVNLVNDGDEEKTINRYDRFCQLIIVPIEVSSFMVVDELAGSDRGDGGFGSTGMTELEKSGSDSLYRAELELDEILEWTEYDNID